MTDGIGGAIERELGAALAGRVKALRHERKLSLDGLAASTGLSKGTVVAIERGQANPSIGVLCRLAAAFSMSVPDLLEDASPVTPDEPIERTRPTVLWRSEGGTEARLDASTSGQTMFEIWSWIIAPGDIYTAGAHSRGTRELVSVSQGCLRVTVGSEAMLFHAGEAGRLVTDRPHSYAAEGDGPVSFTMAVLEYGGGVQPGDTSAHGRSS